MFGIGYFANDIFTKPAPDRVQGCPKMGQALSRSEQLLGFRVTDTGLGFPDPSRRKTRKKLLISRNFANGKCKPLPGKVSDIPLGFECRYPVHRLGIFLLNMIFGILEQPKPEGVDLIRFFDTPTFTGNLEFINQAIFQEVGNGVLKGFILPCADEGEVPESQPSTPHLPHIPEYANTPGA